MTLDAVTAVAPWYCLAIIREMLQHSKASKRLALITEFCKIVYMGRPLCGDVNPT